MEMDPAQLYKIGKKTSTDFSQLVALLQLSQSPKYRQLVTEEQRFKVWAHSLGLYHLGHASLDYRVRDAEVVKARLADILGELQSHLDNLLAIARNERLPYEQQALDDDDDDEETEDDESDGTKSDVERDKLSQASDLSSPSTDSPVHEVDFRLKGLTEALDTLYSLAAKIRSPKNRPQRTIEELYKHVPADIRAAYIQEREEVEIAAVSFLHRQYLVENTDIKATQDDAEDVLAQYTSTGHWLIRRTGVANTRRKQQFIYWKEHVIRLSQTRPESPAQKTGQATCNPGEAVEIPLHLDHSKSEAQKQTEMQVMPISTTTATRLPPDLLKPDDLRSAISHQTRVSTVISPEGKKLEWPDPPHGDRIGRYYICPYCKTVCPQKYLQKDMWIVHLIHDLQPYHCTYEQCQDPHRIYGTRQEWIDHESQHTRVWHCQQHGEEFETQPEYVHHLEHSHPDSTPEHFSPALLAAVVGPSLRIHRDCPFCPSAFSDIPQMQSHLIFHLERLAQLALNVNPQGSDMDNESGRSSQSHQVQIRGRQDSVLEDFDTQEYDEHWNRITDRDVTSVVQDMAVLFEATLDPVPEFRPGFRVSEWVRNLPAEDSLDNPPDDTHEPILRKQGNISVQESIQQQTSANAHFATYTVGWICVEPRAMSIAMTMLDNRHYQLAVPRNDNYLYTLGTIGSLKVVIICPKRSGSNTSSLGSLSSTLQSDFTSIEYCFITGVASGIPPKVRLGDIVISTPREHIQVPDFSQWNFGSLDIMEWQSGWLPKIPRTLLAALRKVKLQQKRVSSRITEHVEKAKSALSTTGSIYLKSDQLRDILFKSNYNHVNTITTRTDDASSSHETRRSNQPMEKPPCASCDMSQVIIRPPEEKRVYCGVTASRRQVITNGLERDDLVSKLDSDVLCIEKDAEAFTSPLPYLLLRGISDYADSHRNDSWKDHATASAAACVREMLLYLPLNDAADYGGDTVEKLDWLSAVHYEPQLSKHLEKRAPGTCQWLHQMGPFNQWLRRSGEVFFCHGMPGSGKSVLAAAVIDHLGEVFHLDETVRICYVFCRFEQAKQSVLDLMSSILRQMCQVQPSLPQIFHDLYEENRKRNTKPSVDEICSAAEELVLMSSRTFIVVDALDELEPWMAQQFISRLFALQHQTKANIFATSRSVYDIVQRFQDHKSLVMEHRARERDVEIYLDRNMDQMPNFVHADPNIQDELKSTIVRSTDGMFQYAEVLFESVRECTTPERMRSILNHCTRHDELLDTTMVRIQKQEPDHADSSIQILMWITFAFRPLTIEELQHALAVELGDSGLDQENIPHEAFILSDCCGLISLNTDTRTVEFCHPSVLQYFKAHNNKWFPDAPLHITKACLTYLSFDTFATGMAQSEEEYNNRLLLNPFFEYASQWWGPHACDEPDRTDILNFLGKQQNVAAVAQVFFKSVFKVSIFDVTEFGQPVGLHLAACFGLIEAANILLGTYDVNLKGFGDLTALQLATLLGQKSMAEFLIYQHADIESKDSLGRTALSLAAFLGQEFIAKLLIKHGAKVQFQHLDGLSPFWMAIERGDEGMAQLFLRHGADIWMENANGQTPLFYAAREGHEDLVELLLSEDAKVDQVKPYKVLKGREWIADLLVSHGAAIEWIEV